MNIGEFNMYDLKKMYKQFYIQKWNAINKRNIKWELTFEEWCDIWIKSEKYYLRGIKHDQYCMCRFNDQGSYSIDNVRIDTGKSNILEAKPLRTLGIKKRWSDPLEKQKQSDRLQKIVKTDEYKEKMRQRSQSDWYENNRKANAEAIRKSKAKPLIATNILTGESFKIIGEKMIKELGFNPGSVSLCANGKSDKHKGYTFVFEGKI